MTPGQVAVELMRRLNQRDVDGAVALLAPDAELFVPRHAPRTVYRGPGLRDVHAWLVDAYPTSTFAIQRVTAGETGATVEFEAAGTSRGGQRVDTTGGSCSTSTAG
jgi:ketosteroid isomerase-like protein